MTRNLLDRLDAAIDGLCPCGAEPRPDSAYCSYDCEPTHRSIHTTSDHDGTPMRWRPDLVTAHDDAGLTRLDEPGIRTGYHGNYNPTVYQRTNGIFHFRLDDGHRYVGCDIAAPTDDNGVFTWQATAAMQHTWQRLEQEIGNQRNLEPDHWRINAWDIWQRQRQHARNEHTREQICAWLRANQLDPDVVPVGSPIRIHDGQITVNVWVRDDDGELQINGDDLVTQPHTAPLVEPWPAGLHYDHLHIHVDLSRAFAGFTDSLRNAHAALAPLVERMRYFVDAVVPQRPRPEPDDHPLDRIRALRRNQPHGPQQRQRPPRHLTR